MKAKRWSKKAEHALLHGIGFYGVAWFQRQGGPSYDYPNAPKIRSRGAVYAKARALFGPGGLTRGVATLKKLARETGYSPTQLRRAGAALNQKWKRLGPKGVFLLTDEQTEDIIEWLKHDYWSKALRLYSCVWCGKHDKPHKGAGLCTRCYWQHRRACVAREIPESVEYQLVWINANLSRNWTQSEAAFLFIARTRLVAGKALSRDQLDQMGKLTRKAGR